MKVKCSVLKSLLLELMSDCKGNPKEVIIFSYHFNVLKSKYCKIIKSYLLQL